MSLTLITDRAGGGIYLAGFNIAPDTALIRAQSFGDAWDAWAEHLAANGELRAIDIAEYMTPQEIAAYEQGDIELSEFIDGAEWIDGLGFADTSDLVMSVIKYGRTD